MKAQDEQLAAQAVSESTEIVPTDFLQDTVNAGTEEMTTADMNTPTLSIIQKTSETGIKDPHIGYFYRKDTGEQMETVQVHMVYVTSVTGDNYNKTGVETKKIYYGFYKGTKEPFKLYVRGWSMNGHRNFQTEVALIKNKYRVPMFALDVTLSTKDENGTSVETGKPYTTKSIVFTIAKKQDGKPVTDMVLPYAEFLAASIDKFKEVSLVNDRAEESKHDAETNE